jgi:hypothetical protein
MNQARIIKIVSLLILSGLAVAQEPVKISAITNSAQLESAEVMQAFRKNLRSQSKLFSLVDNSDSSAGLIFLENCLTRDTTQESYTCFYTTHYAGGTHKTFMGGGVYVSKTAGEMADTLLSAVAQDILERWDEIARANALETFESCLFLTQSACAVPKVLVPEFKSKTMNLSQYLQKSSLK